MEEKKRQEEDKRSKKRTRGGQRGDKKKTRGLETDRLAAAAKRWKRKRRTGGPRPHTACTSAARGCGVPRRNQAPQCGKTIAHAQASPCCSLFAGLSCKKKLSGRAGEPPSLLVAIFSALSSSCSSIACLFSFFKCSLAAAASLSPVVLLLSSLPLLLVLLCSPLAVLPHSLRLSCCRPFALSGRSLSFLVLLVCSCCFRPVSFSPLLSSSCLPLVFLLSCGCRAAYVAFRGRGWSCGRPPQQQQQQRHFWYSYANQQSDRKRVAQSSLA